MVYAHLLMNTGPPKFESLIQPFSQITSPFLNFFSQKTWTNEVTLMSIEMNWMTLKTLNSTDGCFSGDQIFKILNIWETCFWVDCMRETLEFLALYFNKNICSSAIKWSILFKTVCKFAPKLFSCYQLMVNEYVFLTTDNWKCIS